MDSHYLAGLFRRLVANVADGLLFAFALWVPLFLGQILAGPRGEGAIAFLGWLIVSVLYFWLFAHGTTFGKSLLRLQVVRTNGEAPGFWTMLLRESVGKWLSTAFFALGYFWAVWDKDRQAWHDKLAGTVVIHAR